MAYNLLPDFIFDQFMGYQSVNILHENIRYLTETLTEIGPNDNLSRIKLIDNVGMGSPIAFVFSPGTSRKFDYDSVTSAFRLTTNLWLDDPPTKIKKGRLAICLNSYSFNEGAGTSVYFGGKLNTGSTNGWVCPYDGVIMGMHIALCATSSHTATLTARLIKDGSTVKTSSQMVWSAEAGTKVGYIVSSTRDSNDITAGEELDIDLNVVSGTAVAYTACGIIEIAVDL